jgi:hypothetical protein
MWPHCLLSKSHNKWLCKVCVSPSLSTVSDSAGNAVADDLGLCVSRLFSEPNEISGPNFARRAIPSFPFVGKWHHQSPIVSRCDGASSLICERPPWNGKADNENDPGSGRRNEKMPEQLKQYCDRRSPFSMGYIVNHTKD